MSNGDRWMPLYVADYLGDTMHLTTLQHGAYMLLLMHYWKAGPLPDDQEALAAITKVDAKTWPSVWVKLRGFFVPNGDGTLHQKRMDKERDHWTDLSEKRREAGKRGAEAKHRPHPSNGSVPPTPLPQSKHEQPPVVPRHVIPQPGGAAKALAIARNLPGDNLAIATDLPDDLPQPLPGNSGNCHPFATGFATPPVPSTEESKVSNLPSTSPVLARVAAACDTPPPGTYGAEPEQKPAANAMQLATQTIVGRVARKLESTGKTPQGKRAQLTVVQQIDQTLRGPVLDDDVLVGEILPFRRGPVEAERTPEQQYAELMGIPLAEAARAFGRTIEVVT